jgi:murein L,D-transpeptidase YafK
VLLIKLRDFINDIDYDYNDRQLLLSIKEEVNESEDIINKEVQKELNDNEFSLIQHTRSNDDLRFINLNENFNFNVVQ